MLRKTCNIIKSKKRLLKVSHRLVFYNFYKFSVTVSIMTKDVKEIIYHISERSEPARIWFDIDNWVVSTYGTVLFTNKNFNLGRARISGGGVESAIIESLKYLLYNLEPDEWAYRRRCNQDSIYKRGNAISVSENFTLESLLSCVRSMGYAIIMEQGAGGLPIIEIQQELAIK